MNNLPVHLSFSGIKEYCSDRQMFYKKYVLREWDENKWFNTIVGSGVHKVIEEFYKKQFPDQTKSIQQFVKEQFDLFKEGKVILNDEDINGRDKTDPEVFREELETAIQRIVPTAMEYINKKMLFKMRGVEIGFKSQVGKALGFPHTRMQLKGIVDAITEDGVIIDWKTCSKFSPSDKVEYMLQAINNALLFAETEGKLPKEVIFVELLNSPSNADKVLEYEAKVALWEKQKEAGEKVRKPSPPKLKENEERYREHVISLDKWKFQAYLELIDRITRELQGENLLALGLPIPSVEAKYGKYDGWQDFCAKILGYNPYTGEVVEKKNPFSGYAQIPEATQPLPEGIKVAEIVDTVYDPTLLMNTALNNVILDELIEQKQGTTGPESRTILEKHLQITEDLYQKNIHQEKADEVTKEYNLISSTKTVRDEHGNWSVAQEGDIVIEDFDDVEALKQVQSKQKKKTPTPSSTSLDSIIPVEI